MQTSAQRILTTHAGSLPRPAGLTALHAAGARNEQIDPDELTQSADAAVRDVLALQIDAGIDIVNDGELGRDNFATHVRHRLSGFAGASHRRDVADWFRYPSFVELMDQRFSRSQLEGVMPAPQAVGEVRYLTTGPIESECARLAGLLDRHRGRYTEAFVTAPSPGIVATVMENAFYPDLETYVRALAAALRSEYESIVRAGFVLQIDAPDLAMERHVLFQDKSLSEFLGFIRIVVAALNQALSGIPSDRVRLHMCWGNYEGPHDLDVALSEIWSEVSRAEVGAFLVSLANPRHAHEVRVFENGALPSRAVLVAGVIDTTTNYVEHPEVVADRIERAAHCVGDPSRVMAGTDCGFESVAGLTGVAREIVWAKLRALAAGAELASKRLFPAAR